MDVIHVGLYGGKSIFGGREQPLTVDVLRCDRYNKCSYYKNKTCLKVRSFLGIRCKYGERQSIKGYTSRAKKYYEFKSKWDSHEKKSELKYPETKLGVVDDYVVIPYPYIAIEEKDDGEVIVSLEHLSTRSNWISLKNFTPSLINEICSHKPRAMMGGEIKDFQKKYVPLFLAHLKETLPDKYAEFVKQFPKYDTEIDYVGRTAYLKTINPSVVCYQSERYPNLNEEWYWNGEILTFENGYASSVNITKGYDILEFKIKPSDKSQIVISDNKQVNENTIFVD